MIGRRLFGRHIAIASFGALSACPAIDARLSSAGITPSEVAQLYGIVKGVAGIATLADPALIPLVNLALAGADPLMAKVEAGVATAQEAASLAAQAQALLVATAKVVTVTPNVA